jgi:hypothetical protein
MSIAPDATRTQQPRSVSASRGSSSERRRSERSPEREGGSGSSSERRRSQRSPKGRGFGAQAVSDEGANVAPKEAEEPACKPDPVPGTEAPAAAISLGAQAVARRAAASRFTRAVRPTRQLGRAALERCLLGLAPGGACRAGAVARAAGALLPHRFTLTLPKKGGLLSAAPSRGRPRLGHPSTLPCGVRTFLDRAMRGRGRPAGSSASRVPPAAIAPPPATGRRRGSRGRRPRCSAPAGRART